MKRTGITIGRQIADAHSVYKASEKHWAEMKPFGVKETELKDFGKAIEQVERVSMSIVHDVVSLEEVRNELKDLLGAYRTSAEIVCNGFKGRDARLERELRVGNSFPANDVKLRAYVEGIGAVLEKHSARLADRGFGKSDQAQLVDAAERFTHALSLRGKERGQARAVRLSRDASMEKLRHMTSYFRRIGRAALKQDAARADFDRVARSQKSKKGAPPASEAA